MSSFGQALRDVRRAVRWHRRLVASALAAVAVALGLSVLAPEPPETVSVVVAMKDLTGGRALSADDLDVVAVPPDVVPDGVSSTPAELLGRVLASPVR
ncbi:MAG: SAF domain-containing protein, partial [Actinomycetota bacterium]|nr:SAF domain-containing protein [Actinomycetota bacterium]